MEKWGQVLTRVSKTELFLPHFLFAFPYFGVWKISSQWQDAIAFLVLLVFLLFRPYGFFGKKIRKAEI
jgi:branched-subunit amino acid ABC-type transport system permease component